MKTKKTMSYEKDYENSVSKWTQKNWHYAVKI